MEQTIVTVKAVFDSAHEIASPAERQAYLDRVCADAPELRRRVEGMLQAYDRAGSVLEPPAIIDAVTGPYGPRRTVRIGRPLSKPTPPCFRCRPTTPQPTSDPAPRSARTG